MTTGFTTATHRGIIEPDWAMIADPFTQEALIKTSDEHQLGSSATYPKDSILEDWMQFARRNCENCDFQLLGTILPVCGAVIGRTIQMGFFGTLYPNLYTMIVAAPGQRKSTLINFARKLAKRSIADESRFMDSMTSEEALFEQFDPEQDGKPDQFLIEDEGNALFTNWSDTSYGKIVSKRFLALYDCKAWSQSFKGNKQGENGSSKRLIPNVSANALIGATFNICRMNKLEVKDGMWRRFMKYPAEGLAREIYFSESIDGTEWNNLAMLFEQLCVTGEQALEYKLSEESKELYRGFKDKNTLKIQEIPNDLCPANEAKKSVLSAEMAFLMKISMVFERCRWVKFKNRTEGVIQADTLQMAYDHIQECNKASDSLENIARRSEIRDDATTTHAQIMIEFGTKQINGFIPLSKTELTNRFCKNSGRRGAMNNFRLYGEIMNDLEGRGLAQRYPIPGSKKVFYLFKNED